MNLLELDTFPYLTFLLQTSSKSRARQAVRPVEAEEEAITVH